MVKKPTYAELENRIKDLEDQCKRYQKTEAELARNTEFTKSLLDAIPTPIFFKDNKGRYLGCNPAFSEIMGVRAQDIMGKTVHELWPSEHAEVYHQKDLELMQNPTHQVYEFEVKDKDGKIRPVIYYKNAFYDEHGKVAGLVGGFVDISKQKAAEKVLKEANEIIKESPAVAFLWKNEEGWPVEYASENVDSLLGYTAEEIMSGKVSYVDVVHPEDLDRVGEEVATFSAEKGLERFDHIPYRIVAQDGGVKWVRDSTSIRRDQNGNITHYHGIVEDITETIRNEKSLRESEERFREFAENIREVFWLFDWENQKVLYVSPAYEKIWGRPVDDLLARYEEWGDSIHTDDLEYAQESFAELVERGRDEPREYRIVRPDGNVRWILDQSVVIRDADNNVIRIAGIAEDITERKQIEIDLKNSERFLQDVFNGIRDGISVLDTDLNIVRVNRWMDEMYADKGPLCGKKCHEVYQNRPDVCPWCPSMQTLRTGKPHTEEVPLPRVEGKQGWLALSAFPLKDANNEITGVIEHVKDITDRKQVEEELGKYRQQLERLVQERTRELEAAQEELLKKERLAVLGQLTATVSHELRNPLGVVRSSAFYLQQKNKEQDPKIIKHINRIEDQVEICDAIVSELLEYTRGRHSQMVRGDINSWLKQIQDELIAVDNIRLNFDLEKNIPEINFDKEKIRRVFVNLIDNASQAVTERESITTDAAYEPEIKVISKAIDGGILVKVVDNGIGMTDETIAQAFEPLFTTRARGTGLGLANVKKIIEEHNGTVGLESKPNAGTAVIITMPAHTEV